jgi:hypothetical protein
MFEEDGMPWPGGSDPRERFGGEPATKIPTKIANNFRDLTPIEGKSLSILQLPAVSKQLPESDRRDKRSVILRQLAD